MKTVASDLYYLGGLLLGRTVSKLEFQEFIYTKCVFEQEELELYNNISLYTVSELLNKPEVIVVNTKIKKPNRLKKEDIIDYAKILTIRIEDDIRELPLYNSDIDKAGSVALKYRVDRIKRYWYASQHTPFKIMEY